LRDDLFHLAITDQGVAANDGKVKWFVAVDDFEDPVDKFLPLTIPELAKSGLATEMIIVVRVAARTS
jgi:hypothetical protein